MPHQWEIPQSDAEQEITVAYGDHTFPDFPLYESYMQSLSNEQISDLNIAAGTGSATWGWLEDTDFTTYQSTGQEVPLLESTVGNVNASIEPSSEGQSVKHPVFELEQRVNRLEEEMKYRMGEVEQIVENLQSG